MVPMIRQLLSKSIGKIKRVLFPTLADICEGKMRGYDTSQYQQVIFRNPHWKTAMQWMTTLYFPESGDELLFWMVWFMLMGGNKMASDIQFLIDPKSTCAEMMRQIVFSMFFIYQIIKANLGKLKWWQRCHLNVNPANGRYRATLFSIANHVSNLEQAQIQVVIAAFLHLKNWIKLF